MDSKSSSWSLLSLKKCSNTKTDVLSPTNIVLDCCVSYNIEMQIRHGKKIVNIMLSGVPGFLIEAFDWLQKNDALKMQGLFRKEGSANRMRNPWKTLCGLVPIDPELTVHDVCSLIKRFFREIRTPIFNDNQVTLMKFAETIPDKRVLLDAIFTVIESLPASYISTIAFLMRNLKKVSEHSATNMMPIDNLATVFAPALFRDDMLARSFSSSHGPIKKREPEASLLNLVRQRNDVQISIVRLLIQHSDFIGNIQAYKIPCEPEMIVETEDKARLQRKPALMLATIIESEEPRDAEPIMMKENKEPRYVEPTLIELEAPRNAETTIIESEEPRGVEPMKGTQEIDFKDSECMVAQIMREKKTPDTPDFKNSECLVKQITKAKTAKELPFSAPRPPVWSNRPSVVYFQQHNKGFVQQRRAFFSNLG